MASPTNVSLPSIHEMFPAHLLHRDKLDAMHPRAHHTSPTACSTPPSRTRGSRSMPHSSSILSNSTCTIAGCHCSSVSTSSSKPPPKPSSSRAFPPYPQAGYAHAQPPPHPHTHAHVVAHQERCGASHGPYDTPTIASAPALGFPHARLRSHQDPLPHGSGFAPSGRCPPHPQRPHALAFPHPRDERERERRRSEAYALPPPSAHHHQHQASMDTSDFDMDEEDSASASEGELDSPPRAINMQMQAQLSHLGPPQTQPGVPAPHTQPQGMLARLAKKHMCPTCFKRFNRPSSLRIHVNTHTGVTPFHCPWPDCGRSFNVNSNMRRHYRNHTTPTTSTSTSTSSTSASQVHLGPLSTHPAVPPPLRAGLGDPSMSALMDIQGGHMPLEDGRRKRRRMKESGPVGRLGGVGDERKERAWQTHNPNQFQLAYIQDRRRRRGRDSMSDRDEQLVELVGGVDTLDELFVGEQRDRMDVLICVSPSHSASDSPSLSPALSTFSGPSSRSSQSSQSWSPATSSPAPLCLSSSYSKIAITPKTNASPTIFEALGKTTKPRYNPSTPYSLSVADTRVSTVLRPAFLVGTGTGTPPSSLWAGAGRTVEVGPAC